MKVDAVILGAELDGYLAAVRLLQAGASVRLLSSGSGSLPYAPGGIRVLGYHPGGYEDPLADPLSTIDALDEQHPYRKIGSACVRDALDWFFLLAEEIGHSFAGNGCNVDVLSPAGLTLPVFAPAPHQASLGALAAKSVAVLEFAGHRDFPAPLLAAALRRLGLEASLTTVPPPADLTETAALARSFDRLVDPDAYFESLAPLIPSTAEVVLSPAIFGLRTHHRILEVAAKVLGQPCLEVPTLPPSVPGLRLSEALERWLRTRGALLHPGVRIVDAAAQGDRVTAVLDDRGEAFEAEVFVLAAGGVLMGGLVVESGGGVREPIFDLGVAQTRPLERETMDGGLGALHGTGVETDRALRPVANGSARLENLFVTGRMLGHWNPAEEGSAEGVSIGTGWAAADAAIGHLGGRLGT